MTTDPGFTEPSQWEGLPDVTIRPAADECYRIVVAGDRWPGRTAKQRAARQEAVVEEQHPLEKWLAFIAAELDRCSEAMA